MGDGKRGWRYSIGPKIEIAFRKSTMRRFEDLERPLCIQKGRKAL